MNTKKSIATQLKEIRDFEQQGAQRLIEMLSQSGITEFKAKPQDCEAIGLHFDEAIAAKAAITIDDVMRYYRSIGDHPGISFWGPCALHNQPLVKHLPKLIQDKYRRFADMRFN